MRTVVDRDEVAHLWAHRTQEYARDRGSRFYFKGDTIYSYGEHFPIARHVYHGGHHTVLFTCRKYSPTTSTHKSCMRSALRGHLPCIVVADLFPDQARTEFRYYTHHAKPRGHRT